MKKLILSMIFITIITIIIFFNLVLLADIVKNMSSNVNIPLLILATLIGLFIIIVEFLFYSYKKIYLEKNTIKKKTNDIIIISKETPLLKRFDVALETRNFEIEMLWKRSNYFLALNTAIAVGFFSLLKKDMSMDLYALLFCVIGCFVCIAWINVNLGSKFWQAVWEEILTEISGDMELDYFVKSDDHKDRVRNNLVNLNSPKILEKYYNYLVLDKPSVSKWMTLLSFFFLLVWFYIGGFICYKIKKELILMWIASWPIMKVIFRLLKFF